MSLKQCLTARKFERWQKAFQTTALVTCLKIQKTKSKVLTPKYASIQKLGIFVTTETYPNNVIIIHIFDYIIPLHMCMLLFST